MLLVNWSQIFYRKGVFKVPELILQSWNRILNQNMLHPQLMTWEDFNLHFSQVVANPLLRGCLWATRVRIWWTVWAKPLCLRPHSFLGHTCPLSSAAAFLRVSRPGLHIYSLVAPQQVPFMRQMKKNKMNSFWQAMERSLKESCIWVKKKPLRSMVWGFNWKLTVK